MLNLSCNNCAGGCNINRPCDAINSWYDNLILVCLVVLSSVVRMQLII
jgi:hypothetical protein